jgi:hypothetical protein
MHHFNGYAYADTSQMESLPQLEDLTYVTSWQDIVRHRQGNSPLQ